MRSGDQGGSLGAKTYFCPVWLFRGTSRISFMGGLCWVPLKIWSDMDFFRDLAHFLCVRYPRKSMPGSKGLVCIMGGGYVRSCYRMCYSKNDRDKVKPLTVWITNKWYSLTVFCKQYTNPFKGPSKYIVDHCRGLCYFLFFFCSVCLQF